jgi:Dolichyl-phosphate-mannose-protein mannosyltransferase
VSALIAGTPVVSARRWWALLAFGAAAHLAATFFWLRDAGFFDRPPHEDAAVYRLHAALFLARGGDLFGILREAFAFEFHHPPLYPIAIALASRLLGAPPEGVVLWIPTAVAGLLFVFGSGLIIRAVVPSRGQLLAAVLVLAAPGFVVYLRPMMSQMPMVALTLMCLGHLLSSRGGASRGHLVLAGIWGGVALLTKNLAVLEVGFAAAAYFAVRLFQRPRAWRAVVAGVAWFAAPLLAIAAPWYAIHLRHVLGYGEAFTSARGQSFWSNAIPLWSFERWLLYPTAFARHCAGFPAATVAACVIVLAEVVRRRGAGGAATDPGLATLAIASVLSYGVISVGQLYPEAFFILQWIPVYAALTATAACSLPPRWSRVAAALLVLASVPVGLSAYRPWDSDEPLVRVGGFTVVDRFDSRRLAGIARDAGCRGRPRVEHWPVAELVDAAAAWAPGRRAVVGMVSLDDDHARFLEFSNVIVESLEKGVDVRLRYLVGERSAQAVENDMMMAFLAGSGLEFARIGSPASMVAALRELDLVCVDARVTSPDELRALARSAGLEAELLFDVPVTDRWRFRLFGLRPGR